jgi:hypothetical protein
MTDRLTPFLGGDFKTFSDEEKLYEKDVLKYGSYIWNGEKWDVTPEYVDKIIQAFEDGAYDQVPLQWAADDNSHGNGPEAFDPDRFRGEVRRFIKTPTGMKALVKLSNEGEQSVMRNPNLGVSARIIEGKTRLDGKHYPVAVNQVLATLDPKMKGLGGWKKVTLSEPLDENSIKNMSDASYEEMKEDRVPEEQKNEEIEALKTAVADLTAKIATLTGGGGENEPGDELDQETIDALAEADRKRDEAIALANSNADEAIKRARALSENAMQQSFKADSQRWLNGGVPPRIVELSEKVLTQIEPVKVISLSDDGKEVVTDARSTVRAMLDELTGMIDLSEPIGREDAPPIDDTDQKAIDSFVSEINSF